MTNKRYLSNKKTSQQTISISPSLKDWIKRYVSVKGKEFPDDERYKSISSFYCSIMENILKMFEEGKTLDDFDRLVDKKMDNFFSQLSAEFLIPMVESELRMHRYLITGFEENARFFLGARKNFVRFIDFDDYSTIKTAFNRIKKRFMAAKVTKSMNLDFFTEKGNKQFRGVIEHIGLYKNCHHVNCKMLAEALGIIGFKIIDFLYSEEELYYRFEVVPTDLFFSQKLEKKKRIDLLKHNVEYVINYNRILDDTADHLWVKMAGDSNAIVNFKNDEAREKWIETIENDLRKFGTKEEILLKLLKYFEHLHWIRIENEEELSFRINLLKPKNEMEIEFILKHLSKYSKISEKKDVYYLGKVDL